MEKIQFHIEFPHITALQPFLMLADPPLTRHVTTARQSCTVFTNNNGKRPTLLLSALTAVFGKSARVSFASDLSEEQSMLNHNSQSCLFSFCSSHIIQIRFRSKPFSIGASDSLIISKSSRWLTPVPPLNTQTIRSAESPWRRRCFRVEGKNVLAKRNAPPPLTN